MATTSNFNSGGIGSSFQTTPDDPTKAMTSGIETGIALAMHKENVTQQRAKLQMDMETHKQQSMDKFFDVMTKAGRVKGPAQQALFDLGGQLAPMAGLPVPTGLFTLLKSSGEDVDAAKQALSAVAYDPKKILSSPELQTHLQNLLGQTPDQVMGGANGLMAAAQKQRVAETLAGSKTQAVGAGLIKQGINPEAITNPGVATAEAGRVAGQKTALNNATIGQKTALGEAATENADTNSTNAETKQGQLGAYKDRTQAQKEATMARIQQMGLKTSQGDRRIIGTFQEQLNKSLRPLEDNLQAADKGIDILSKPNVRWIDLNEASTDVAKLLSNSNVVPQSREEKQTFTSLRSTWDKWVGKAENQEVGGPSPEEISIFKDRLSRLRSMTATYHDNQLDAKTSSAVKIGRVSPTVGQTLFETMRASPGSTFHGNTVGPTSPFMKPTTSLTSGPGASIPSKTLAPDLLQTIKGRFGGDTARLQKFLDSQGYNYNPGDLK